MISRINQLPGPLRAVVWLNVILAFITLVAAIAVITSAFTDALVNIASAAISILVVAGILQRSKVVRTLVLIFAWLGIVFTGFGAIFALFTIGIIAVMAVIPLGINILTVWGLTAASSRRYFGIGQPEPPPLHRDWMGNDMRATRD